MKYDPALCQCTAESIKFKLTTNHVLVADSVDSVSYLNHQVGKVDIFLVDKS